MTDSERAPFRQRRVSLSERTLITLGAVFLAAVVVSVYVVISVERMTRLSEEERRAELAEGAAEELQTQVLRDMLLLRRYKDTRDPRFLNGLEVARTSAAHSEEQLREYTHLPEVLEALGEYDRLMSERLATAEALVAAVSAGDDDALEEAIMLEEQLDSAATTVVVRIVEAERRDLERLFVEAVEGQRSFRLNVLTTMAITLLIVSALLYSVFASGVTRRLSQLTDMARRVAVGDYSQGSFKEGRDEIAVLAKALNEMAHQLAEFDKIKEEFVALAAHQLRTPATAVKGNLEMLLEGYFGDVTPEQFEVLRDANASNERQLSIIQDLLIVARTDTGRLLLTKSATDLARMTAEVVADLAPAARARRQTVTLDLEPGAIVLSVDAQKIRMVIENLLSNACKYTPDGGRISARLRRENGAVALAVADTGVGIGREDFGRLFKKFSRVSNPVSDIVGGTGLGLYLANEIVKLHGGVIDVASVLGAGTTFTVRLPQGA